MNPKYKQLLCMALLCSMAGRAQVTVGGAVNAGGRLSDWTSQAVNPATYSYSTAGSTSSVPGIFEHYGPSGTGASSALVVNGDYDATTFGRDVFYGPNNNPGPQAIGGGNRARFGELQLLNGNGVPFTISNSNGIYVENNLLLQNGVTLTSRTAPVAGSVFMGPTATVSGAGSTRSINGYVTRIGGTAFTFPVSSQSAEYRPLTVSAAANGAASAIAVAYFDGSPASVTDPTDGGTHALTGAALGAGLVAVSPKGFWDFQLRTGVTGNSPGSVGSHAVPSVAIPVSVSIPDMTQNGSGFPASSMVLVGWDAGQSKWIQIGPANATGNTAGNTLSGTVPAGTDVTAIAIGSISSFILPVQLAQFSAMLDAQCTAQLSWTTTSEARMSRYVVEYSADGGSYAAVASTLARNAADGANYRLAFAGVQPGRGYFRLRMECSDGEVKYSAVASVNASCDKTAITISPNPVPDVLHLNGLPPGSTVQVCDANGRRVITQKASGNQLQIDLSHTASGTYSVQVVQGGKVLKQETVVKL